MKYDSKMKPGGKGLGLSQPAERWTSAVAQKARTVVKDSRLPYSPGRDGPPAPRPKPGQRFDDDTFQPMDWDTGPMDSDPPYDPPGYDKTSEYVPDRDGTADGDIPNWEGGDVGAEEMGKQENNQKWRYNNWRSENGNPIPEDRAHIFNEIFDEASRKMPSIDENDTNPTEVAMWERNVRRQAAEAGLSREETDKLIEDLFELH